MIRGRGILMKLLRMACGAGVIALLATDLLMADVLVLRDGRRVEGTLVSVRGNEVDFRESGRVRRFDRDDIRSIQFDFDEGGRRGGGGSGPGMRERTVSVDARAGWNDTGIDVRGGQEVRFVATGQVRWGPGRRDGAGGENDSPVNRARPMPNRNAAALIGRIGPGGDPFFIGNDSGSIRVRGAGRLFLGINDDFLQDNSGSFRVVVSY